MILVDTSVWVGHLRSPDARLAALLEEGMVLGHAWVLGELALGGVTPGHVALLTALPQAVEASSGEVAGLIAGHRLAGTAIGYVDAQLLASTLMTPAARLATHDRRLHAVAERLGCAAPA